MIARLMNDFSPLWQLSNQMDRLLDSVFEPASPLRPYSAAYPGLNAWEDSEAGYVEAELPGMTFEDLDITVASNRLTIAGKRAVQPPEHAEYLRRERSQGSFSRTITVPWQIDEAKVEAKLHNGVLTVKLPKCDACKPRRIEVQSA